jgi:hypothetical protein
LLSEKPRCAGLLTQQNPLDNPLVDTGEKLLASAELVQALRLKDLPVSVSAAALPKWELLSASIY